MRFKYLLIGAVLLIFSCGVMTQNKKNEQRKPNLLFIITDQHRYDALSIAGNSVLKTPNLDRLASGGAYFKSKPSGNHIL